MWGVLFSALMAAAAALLPRLLLAFGVFAFSASAVKPYFDFMFDMIMDHVGGAGQYSHVLYAIGLVDALRVVFSAYITAISIKAGRAALAKSAGTFTNPTAGK